MNIQKSKKLITCYHIKFIIITIIIFHVFIYFIPYNTFFYNYWIHDKIIKDGCSLKRPDLLLDMGSHIINIEIDENSHTNYDNSCKNKRIMTLSQNVGCL